jgi:hypothetical protein
MMSLYIGIISWSKFTVETLKELMYIVYEGGRQLEEWVRCVGIWNVRFLKEKSHGLSNYCSIGTARSNEAVQIRPGKQRPTLSISLGLSDCECGNHGGGAASHDYGKYEK